MSQQYGMLPSELLQRANTIDLQLHYAASLIKLREDKRARGENINDTYTKSEIEDMYNKFKNRNNGD
jgi:hypothetical protein